MDEPLFRADEEWVVVVVENDPALLNSLRFTFDVDGYATRTFASSSEILTASDLPERGCLVLDYDLPGMNGLALLGKLRRRGLTQPAILITSNPHKLLREARADHAVVVVEKPLLGSALTDAIHSSRNRA